MQFYDADTGLYKLIPDNGGFQLQWRPDPISPHVELIPLSPDAVRLLAWELLRATDPEMLADPHNRPVRKPPAAIVVDFPAATVVPFRARAVPPMGGDAA